MKKFFTGLAIATVCFTFNCGLTNEAQAASLDSSVESGNVETQELYGPPPPGYGPPPPPHGHRKPHPRYMPPPPPPSRGDRWDSDYPPPPPPGHRPPPRW